MRIFADTHIIILCTTRIVPLTLLGLAGLSVAAHELIYATSCIDELLLARVEGVRRAGDFQLNEGISFAFEFNSFVRLACRT